MRHCKDISGCYIGESWHGLTHHFSMRRYKGISGCRLLRVLIKTLIFDVTYVNMDYLSENPAGDNAEATSPRRWD